MIHARQLEDMDCARAMAQIETEKPFGVVAPHFPANVGQYGTPYGTLWWACQNIQGATYQLVIKKKPENLGKYLKRQKLKTSEIYLCERTNITNPLWRLHYVGFDMDENLYDPLEYGVIPAKQIYESHQKDWLIFGIIRRYIP